MLKLNWPILVILTLDCQGPDPSMGHLPWRPAQVVSVATTETSTEATVSETSFPTSSTDLSTTTTTSTTDKEATTDGGLRLPSISMGGVDNVTVQEGETVFLECTVVNQANWTVSWIRVKDSRILTLGRDTIITDHRLAVIGDKDKGQFLLQIRGVKGEDAGKYECQVSTSPKTSNQVEMTVVVPQVRIYGPQIVKQGSSVVLECHVSHALHQPPYVLWQHDGLGLPQAKSQLSTVNNGTVSKSVLRLDNVSSSRHTGNYSCVPAKIHPTTVVIHIESEKRLPYIRNAGCAQAISGTSFGCFLLMALIGIFYC